MHQGVPSLTEARVLSARYPSHGCQGCQGSVLSTLGTQNSTYLDSLRYDQLLKNTDWIIQTSLIPSLLSRDRHQNVADRSHNSNHQGRGMKVSTIKQSWKRVRFGAMFDDASYQGGLVGREVYLQKWSVYCQSPASVFQQNEFLCKSE